MKTIINKLNEENIKEYRPKPFWSWNDKLDEKELSDQMEWMKNQGFGGFFMHARQGLITEYLSEEWFDLIKSCVIKSKELNMESWAYDDNGWPSGLAGGLLVKNEKYRDEYLSYETGELDKKSFVSYFIDDEKLIRVKDNSNKKGKYLNIYKHVSVSSVDILNPLVVDKFLEVTHKKYKEKLHNDSGECDNFKGFFTDEPQYYRWGHPFSEMLINYFSEHYNMDIFDGLGLMFVKKEGYRDFRYKYWLAMQTLMLKNYSEKIYSWCNENNYLFTGHYVEETPIEYNMIACAGIMPFYEYENIPGIDHIGNRKSYDMLSAKQVSSVAVQLGKVKVMAETFGCCGWDANPNLFKFIAEKQFLNGVNTICQHLLPYSETGQRKRDYPAHFSWVNPWVREDFKSFNDYFARLGYILSKSTEKVKVALFCPVRSMYFDYEWGKNEGNYKIDNYYIDIAYKLYNNNIPFHIIDETVMEKHAQIENNKLVVGKCSYDYVVFPEVYTMGKFCKSLFEKYYSCGGKMFFYRGLPEYTEGEKCAYLLKSNISFDDLLAEREVDTNNDNIKISVREIDGKRFIYALNENDKCSENVTFSGAFRSLTKLDIEQKTFTNLSENICFAPCESMLLFFSDEKMEPERQEKQKIVLNPPFNIKNITENYYTLDKISYSKDNVNYSKPLSYMGVFDMLLKERYSGVIYLKYIFDVKEIPSSISLVAEDMNTLDCSVNDHEVVFDKTSDFDKKFYKGNVLPYIKKGVNEILFKINFYEGENVYYALFGKDVQESVRNSLVYDTTIEECYLQGNFGVYSESGFTENKEGTRIFGNNFYIAKAKNTINDFVKDGYPFFAGNVTIEKDFISDEKKCLLDIDGNYCISEVKINGSSMKKSYFAREIDISDYVVKGKNIADITLWSGNRNLFGPHHFIKEEELGFMGPEQITLKGTWKNGVSSAEMKDYSFARFGIFKK